MSAIEGLHCAVCRERIDGGAPVEFCDACGEPVHTACQGSEQCPVCGALSRGHSLPAKSPRSSARQGGRQSKGLVAEFFSGEGRASRRTYNLHHFVGGTVLLGVVYGLTELTRGQGAGVERLSALASVLLMLAGIWSEIAVSVRRLHDTDRSGHYWFLMMVPLVNLWISLVLIFQKGTDGPNQFGDDPTLPSGEGQSQGEQVLKSAGRFEREGDWERAFELYREAAKRLAGEPEGDYAIECIKRLRERIARSESG